MSATCARKPATWPRLLYTPRSCLDALQAPLKPQAAAASGSLTLEVQLQRSICSVPTADPYRKPAQTINSNSVIRSGA